MSNLEHAVELICDPDIREDRRDRLTAEYATKSAAGELNLDPEEDADLGQACRRDTSSSLAKSPVVASKISFGWFFLTAIEGRRN